jgi:hypothetical protein
MKRYSWEPQNGTRYDLCYGQAAGRNLLVWLLRGGSGGIAFAFTNDSFIHYDYLIEKMKIGTADAAGILLFLQKMGHEVCLPTCPDDFGWFREGEEPQLSVILNPSS